MCDKETEDLINLSIEENEEMGKNNSIFVAPLIAIKQESPEQRLSFDNNPFDLVQKLAICRQDDPFEVVEKEASLKAQMSFSRANNDVKTGNLLSLSEDTDITTLDSAHASVFSNSTIYESAEAHDLDSESPPITLSTKWTPESSTADSGGTGVSCDSSDSGKKQTTNTRNRKLRHLRHRLLKMSISNSTYSTPMSSRNAADANDNDEQMIAAESPLKSMFDDLLSEQTPETNYTEKDFDEDLEKMQIPMLNHISPPPIEQLNTSDQNKAELKRIEKQETPPNVSELPDLESIRLKLSAKKSENNRHDINELINNLKTLVCQSTAVNEQKKQQVNNLLNTLCSTLNTPSKESKEAIAQPIRRQGTFMCDAEENNENKLIDIEKPIEVIDEQAAVEVMPDAMIKSSATYDGDTAEDKEHLNLPQIDPPSPHNEHQQHVQPLISEVMEQLRYFMEQQQQLGAPNQHDAGKSTQTSNAASNPTFIVVLNTVSHDEEGNELNAYNQNSNGMRRRSQSLSIHDKLKFIQIPIKSSVEMNSVETFDSPPLSEENMSPLDITEASDFKTPARFLQRRNSFSSGTPQPSLRYSRFSNLALDKSRSNSSQMISQSGTSTARRLNIMDTHTESQLTQTLARPKMDLVKLDLKRKVKTSAGAVTSKGPMRALPLKSVAPNVKANAPQTIASNTSMHLVAKSGHMSNTSTPASELRSKALKVIGKANPNACSTPSVFAPSPAKMGATQKARLSYLATTPIGKSLAAPPTASAAASGLRRRTLSEFKSKSPIKTRSSIASSGLKNAATSSGRSTLLRPTSTIKSTTNKRTSLCGPSANLASKNKENNRP